MKVFQFVFGPDYLQLVVDVSAGTKPEAVEDMKNIAAEMRLAEDPYDLAVSRDYVRVWVTIDPATITEADIKDEWED